MTKWGLSQECKVGLTLKTNHVIYHFNPLKTKTYMNLNRCRKRFWQNPTFIPDTNSHQTRNRKEHSPPDKRNLKKNPKANIILKGERLTSPKIKNMARIYNFYFYSTCTESSSQCDRQESEKASILEKK